MKGMRRRRRRASGRENSLFYALKHDNFELPGGADRKAALLRQYEEERRKRADRE
jgi:hypothetical protein